MMTKLTELTTSKTIILILLMLLVLPFMDPAMSFDDNDALLSLAQLKHNMDKLQAQSPHWQWDDRWIWEPASTGDHNSRIRRGGWVRVDDLAAAMKNVKLGVAVEQSPQPLEKSSMEDELIRAQVGSYIVTYGTVSMSQYDDILSLRINGSVALPPNNHHARRENEMIVQWLDIALTSETALYQVVFDVEALRDFEAEMSLITTGVIIVVVLGLMGIFAMDAKRLTHLITIPLLDLCNEMKQVARFDLRRKKKLIPAPVFEIRKMQKSLLQMRQGLTSAAKFIPRDVVVEMLATGVSADLKVSYKEVTIYFSDIKGFTTICEHMIPVELINMLTEYFNAMTTIIIEGNGSVLDYVGDAVLACWNAPQLVPDHAYRGVEDALRMHDALKTLREKWIDQGRDAVHIRCGLHTAKVFVGNIGSRHRLKYSVLGDGVEMSERLEDGNKKYASRAMITHDTYLHLERLGRVDKFLLRPCDIIKVMDGPEQRPGGAVIWQVVGRRRESTNEVH